MGLYLWASRSCQALFLRGDVGSISLEEAGTGSEYRLDDFFLKTDGSSSPLEFPGDRGAVGPVEAVPSPSARDFRIIDWSFSKCSSKTKLDFRDDFLPMDFDDFSLTKARSSLVD